METTASLGREHETVSLPSVASESSHSAVSWPAIIAGALVAIAIALLLVTLGAGFGFASISPWPNTGASVTTFGIATAIGLIIVHWLASASGGYITGRLRTKWVDVHTHEVFFRDTAHGLLTWALATVVGGLLLTSAVSSVVAGVAHMASTVGSGAAQGAGQAMTQAASGVSGYDVDTLFRSDRPDPGANAQATEGQAARILEGVMYFCEKRA